MGEVRINIRRLKKFAYKELPKDEVLRELLLSEPDKLGSGEFCCKMEIWLKLLRRTGL